MSSPRVRIVVSALEQFVDGIIKKIVLDIVANLRSDPSTGYGTPVLTGWARSNWIPTIGAPHQGLIGSREAVSDASQEQAIALVATSYKSAKGPVFISNNVPYLVLLNEGSSKQAPRGFVQNAVVKALAP